MEIFCSCYHQRLCLVLRRYVKKDVVNNLPCIEESLKSTKCPNHDSFNESIEAGTGILAILWTARRMASRTVYVTYDSANMAAITCSAWRMLFLPALIDIQRLLVFVLLLVRRRRRPVS
jgi:hypothetical protein